MVKILTKHPSKAISVPLGNVLNPFLYSLCTAYIPTTVQIEIYTFLNNTTILSSNKNVKTATLALQNHSCKLTD